MRKPRAARLNLVNERKRLLDGLVHGMRNIAQRVEDEFIHSLQKWERRIRQGTEIGEICRAAKAVSKNFQIAVQQRNRSKCRAKQFERAAHFVKRHAGNRTWFRNAVENVRKRAAQRFERDAIRVDRQRTILAQAERPNIVESHNVIRVGVGEQNGVEAIQSGAQSLLAKIGSRVNYGKLAVA